MPKLGLYDPNSLTEKDGVMRISFINARDARDVESIAIDTTGKARLIRDCLEAQKSSVNCPSNALGHRSMRMDGAIVLPKDRGGEGVLIQQSKTGQRKHTSLKTVFSYDPADIPEKSLGIALGHMEDGTLHVHQLVVQPLAIDPQPATAPQRMTDGS
mgnify:CR=1 FL=1